jgi:hypothetical protein
MWAIACERFVQLVDGTPDGPLQITTERETASHNTPN